MRKRKAVLHANGPGNLFRSWMERCPFPMLATEGESHRVVHANPMWCLMSGKTKETLLGCSVTEAMPEGSDDGGLPALLDRVYRTGEAEYVADREHPDTEHGSAYRSYVVWAVLNEVERPVGLMILVTDSMRAELREINQALMIANVQQHELAVAERESAENARENEALSREEAVLEERNRIAREIHDTLAQAFTGILLQLRIAQRIAGQRPDEAWSLIAHVGELAHEGLAEARRSVWALQSEAHEYTDLVGVLSRTIERMAVGTTAQMELHVHGLARTLSPDVCMNLQRIAQEALANALRHGQARIAWVELSFDPERVLLRIQDDGRGFDLEHQADGGGFGLIGMGQRAERIGGLLTLVSSPGRGTEVAVSVPLPPAAPPEAPS